MTIRNETGHNPAVEAALQPVIEAKRKEAGAEDAVKKIEARLASLRGVEVRQRSNVTALATADKASRDRFVHDLNTTEDRIATAQRNLETAEAGAQSAGRSGQEDCLDPDGRKTVVCARR
ncbi:MAG: hypothetical protein M3O31_12360 [Acidobacteriota bacterium]|nr:hypothetical protein [Acidobacteriota bacterium]